MKKLISFVTIIVLPLLGNAQGLSTGGADQTTQFILKMDSTHRADSIRRTELLHEIENLKGSGTNGKKEVLLRKFRRLAQEDSLRRLNHLHQLTKLKQSAKGFPVMPFGDTLFLVYTNIGSFTARDRAQAISNKIEKLYDDYGFDPDSLLVNISETSAEIVYHEETVMSVNELEALWYNRKPGEIADEYRVRIKQAVIDKRDENKISNIILRVGAIILIIIGIYLVIIMINALFRKLRRKITGMRGDRLKGINFRGYQFLDSKRELQMILFLVNIFRLLIIVLALYIALPLLFSVFPWTRSIANILIGWVATPLLSFAKGFIKYLPNLFTIAVIATVTHYCIKFLKFVAGEIENGVLTIPGFYPDWARPTLNIVKFLVYVFSFILIFPYLPGSDSLVFQGVSVFLGLLFSLGSSSAISNAVAGLVITYMRPFKVGDRVKIGDITGDVIEKSLLVTRVRTIKNEDITLPNSSILSGHTINYTTAASELGLILHTSVTIGYDVPWKVVHELLIQAASATKYIINDDRKPFVLQTSLDDFYVSYQLNVYTDQSHKMASIYSELHQNIQDKFNEANVEIMSPHYRAARDGNMTTVPSSYLNKDYQSPSFNVSMKQTETK